MKKGQSMTQRTRSTLEFDCFGDQIIRLMKLAARVGCAQAYADLTTAMAMMTVIAGIEPENMYSHLSSLMPLARRAVADNPAVFCVSKRDDPRQS